jgi:hypothetical protein
MRIVAVTGAWWLWQARSREPGPALSRSLPG